ncbi:hypothetical protein CMN23_02400 [Candidatus Saccharibacteria bacterium]|nr:hypothetical protein [Candidatus Saccharibacteria bacterium]MBJ58845.1 hypothetical protein [Candidatus Saccharibacteria bacterium]
MSASTQESKQKTSSSEPSMRPPSGAAVIIMTALDTTWRAFAPVIGGTFVGMWLDSIFDISPVGLLICLPLGLVLSIVLIARQLINVRKH